MTRRAWLATLALVLKSSAAQAHVGSPTVIFEGLAGSYPVRVIVRPPDVVPGLADVTVRLLEGSAEEVTVQPIWWWAPKEGGAPPPDVARPVRGEPALFTGSLWLMTSGSYAVRVGVAGARGKGEVLVPVAAVATRRRSMEPLTPDHGKLMHLFLVREPGHDVFAHLHPAPVRAQDVFDAPLPPFPGGRFRVFADVTRETGFAQTLTGVVELPDPPSAAASAAGDADDSFFVPRHLLGVQPYPASPIKPDGFEIRQEPPGGALVAGREVALRFRLVGADGRPTVPEPYMGMAGHAVILRDDASVFVHLHPSGTISMASQQRFGTKVALAAASDHAAHAAATDPILAFPYAFPREGRYRVWVQAKASGLVRTGVFDLAVGPS